MRAMLYGVRRIDMQAADGRQIRGYSLYIGYPVDGVHGVETSKQFVSDDLCEMCSWKPEVDMILNLDFTPKGKITSIATVREN